MNMTRALLYARTLQHLRPVQVYGRVWKALRRESLDERPAPPRSAGGPMAAPARRAPVLVGPTTTRMLGELGELVSPGDWDDPARSALWRYHTHYFDDLRAEGGVTARLGWNLALLERWLGEVCPGVGVGFDPYPTSLRLVNWVRLGLAGPHLGPRAVHSLAVQARALRARLEVHLLGNHLLANAKALVFAGVFFDGPEADEWRAKGLELLAREWREQVLADGGHFERSPMYHTIVLEDLLDLLALAAAVPGRLTAPPAWRELAQRMRRWLAVMSHPDGEIALFNDAAHGQAPSPGALDDYARRLGLPDVAPPTGAVHHLEESGFVRVDAGELTLFCDVGEIGPSYLPGHAHADSLSFEASLHGERWIVDTGTSHYAPGPERLRQRSTAAHNTVEVDGESSSEVWSSFRVARRARPLALALEARGDRVSIAAGHDGYERLRGRVTHRRTWTVGPRELVLDDRLSGVYQSAVGRLHLAPGLGVSLQRGTLDAPRGARASLALDGGEAAVEPTTFHPAFGARLENVALAVRFTRSESRSRLVW